ncbi:polygalacturonase PglA [Pelagibacterium lentulum]|uniref:Polygalacturonase n=1 Tax=Pelagibacterium lentulum TaxID=2029865 RepID=A0A916W1M0_9HYPH|nr:glycoside hydrolase family 28 protein [Pelagibacterium lentulum]GGA59345.1 polygalacturonase [Pelagibacterium lentulum]
MSARIPAILVLTPRTVTVELAGVNAHHRLDEPVAFHLSSDGATVIEGALDFPVKTFENLMPGTRYRLEIQGWNRLEFSAPFETGFVDVRDYGVSEAAADNTSGFKEAIQAAPDGATLYVPQGTWRTGPLFLKSNLTFWLPEGAVITGLSDRAAYPILQAFSEDGLQQASWEGVPAKCYASLLTAFDTSGLSIVGKGIIDGAGDRGDWWSWPKETRNGARRPRTVFANRCTGFSMAGVAVRNSPSWTIHPIDCNKLIFADLDISNPPDSPNTDGLNPDSCTDVTISGVRFSVGDDCIAIKAGKIWPDGKVPAPTRNVGIRHCLMERGHGGVVIGSEMSGSVTDVTVTNCTMIDTDRGLRIKTRRGRGGQVARIAVTDCVMDGVLTPLSINAHYFCDPDGKSDAVQNRSPAPVTAATPWVSEISFARIEARNVHHALAYVLGLAEAPVTELRIEDVSVTYADDAVAAVPDMAVGLPLLRHDRIVTENAIEPVIANIDWPAVDDYLERTSC